METQKKRNAVEWAMHYHKIVILVVTCLVAFGIYSLPNMRKNEFPDFTVRQGIVVAAAPGYTSEQIAEQVAKPLEDYIFTYKEVKKEKTFSKSRDGIVYIQVELNDDLNNKDEFWSKFKHGVSQFKQQLPSGVLALIVQDDFGDTSALLITMESKDKTYRELHDYMDHLQNRLRRISSVGRMTISGEQREQIAVYIDNEKLSHYGLSDKTLAISLLKSGFQTSGGRIKNAETTTPIYVTESFNTVYDVQQQIVYSDPKGNVVRLKDIADIRREYPKADSYITNNGGTKCILLSVEMKKGQNLVKMGEEIDKAISEFQKELPQSVSMYRITDQSQVVSDSVTTFLRELVIAILAVVVVVMLLLPMRVALVAASTIPITIFISLGLFYAFDIELNTVTLAALIVTLGMIVDNSIVIIDNYLEKLSDGGSRWRASIESTTHFFRSIFSATLAISITFFPFLFTTHGVVGDFVKSFPWGVSIVLFVSLLIATMLVPFMQFWFIRKPMEKKEKGFSFLDWLQSFYNRLLAVCLRHPWATVMIGVLSVVVGGVLMMRLPIQMLPYADRNQFAVEITLPVGSSIEETAQVADSLEKMMKRDERVVSITSFKGCSSPRFQTSYAPQIAGTNYAQFIVNTKGVKETVELLNEFTPRYEGYFTNAYVRFKQLNYSDAVYPIEIRLSGDSISQLKAAAADVEKRLRKMPELLQVQTDYSQPLPSTDITLDADRASRLGISNADVETTLALRYGDGLQAATVWEGDYSVPVKLKSLKSDSAQTTDVENERIPVLGGLDNVPLRQIATVNPSWKDGQIVRRAGSYTITVSADLQRGLNAMQVTNKVKEAMSSYNPPEGVTLAYGGEDDKSNEMMPQVMGALAIAAVIIFFILLSHSRNISIATLIFMSMALCLFGTAIGIMVQGVSFSITSVLGIVSLMGIIVRNGIIMIDYAEELRHDEHMLSADAIHHSAERRMRPIFLTSAAASMGVIPMILGGSGLWLPMGTVVCYGTLITMVLILTVLPAAYKIMFRGTTRSRIANEAIENE